MWDSASWLASVYRSLGRLGKDAHRVTAGHAQRWGPGLPVDFNATEEQWLACGDPMSVLAGIVCGEPTGRASGRKLRLAAAACCRRVWRAIIDGRCWRAVEAAETAAEGREQPSVEALRKGCNEVIVTEDRSSSAYRAAWGVYRCLDESALTAASSVVEQLSDPGRYPSPPLLEAPATCALFRCIFGNPFRKPVLAREWLTADVVLIAQATYQEWEYCSGRLDNARLAVLSDALEEAGCTDADILSHLRSPGPHVRGCWPLDLILGKH
jgi:hypothetical protein